VKRGDIAIVVVSGELGKPRPAVVVQADELGDKTTTVLVCPLSSDTQEASGLRPAFEPSTHNGLRVVSQAMADKITPLRRDRIRQLIGSLNDAERDRLDRALLIVLGLAR
jgi:mRNA interferase MazF